MDESFRYKKWVVGILVPLGMVIWGVSIFLSKKIDIPIERLDWHPFDYYYYLPLHGWSAMFMAAAIIAAGVTLHLGYFWSLYPACERISSRIATYAAWTAVILCGIGAIGGAIEWIPRLIRYLKDFCR